MRGGIRLVCKNERIRQKLLVVKKLRAKELIPNKFKDVFPNATVLRFVKLVSYGVRNDPRWR
jgi:hypothetical protein